MNGAAIDSSVAVDTVSSTDWQVVGNGDYNGDGNADILWRNSVDRPELDVPDEWRDDR